MVDDYDEILSTRMFEEKPTCFWSILEMAVYGYAHFTHATSNNFQIPMRALGPQ